MEDTQQHFAAHPYYLMGVKAEKLRIIDLLNDSHIDKHNGSLALCPACTTYELLFPATSV